ncbi:MAG: ATP-binding cassette domain-containing protein [candidate division Zixibacteria bacterium]|nr:ATP-binding cassette domain-containing protein [candidate division Zixibacteria bacterium]
MNKNNGLKDIFYNYLKRYKWHWIIGFLTLACATGLTVLMPLVLRNAVNKLEFGGSPSQLLTDAFYIVGISLSAGIFRFFALVIVTIASRKIEYDLHSDFFEHIEKLGRKFFDKSNVGDLVSRGSNDVEAVQQMHCPGFYSLLYSMFIIPLAVVLMFRVDPTLTLYSMIPMPFLALAVYLLGKYVYGRYHKIQVQLGKLSASVQENLWAIRVVKAFDQGENQIRRFEAINNDYVRKYMNMVRLWALFYPVIYMIAGLMMLVVLLIGGARVINDEITLGTFVAFVAYLVMLVWPMAGLGWVLGMIQRGFASYARLKEIFDIEPEISSLTETQAKTRFKGDIEFKNVSFAYYNSPVLEDISFKVKPGQKVAVVGATGSGKSTLVSLIPRLYEVTGGSIFIDGKDINSLDMETLRSNIGTVPQDVYLFSRTVGENIAFGCESKPSPAEIKTAAKVADLLKDIEKFPEQFNTLVGEKGVTLSGGQKQRTSIARAIIKKPPILIFDDAFSSVDTDTERHILNGLHEIIENCTVFVISHRVSTFQNADLILVLDEGKLVEQGNHETLLAQGGVYANIYKRQQLTEELEKI